MNKTIPLKEMENVYREAVQHYADKGKLITVDKWVDIALNLYENALIESVPTNRLGNDADMLLFQYGTYNWGGDLGEHFSFDITRQIIDENEEMYQLIFALIYPSSDFKKVNSFNSWNTNLPTLEEWRNLIKTTKGYKQCITADIKQHQISFFRV